MGGGQGGRVGVARGRLENAQSWMVGCEGHTEDSGLA